MAHEASMEAQAVDPVQTQKILKDIITKVNRQKQSLMSSTILVLAALVGHAFVAGGMYSGMKHDIEANTEHTSTNAEAIKANAQATKVVADEQLRQTQNVSAVSDLKAEIKTMRELLQAVRDDVLLLKARTPQSEVK